MALHPKKTQKCWIWKAYCRDTGSLVDWQCGKRDAYTFKKLYQRLSKWQVSAYATDYLEAYRQVIHETEHRRSKSETVAIERNNGRQRHWFARFRRKSIVVSKTQEMVDITMAMFAAFHINKSIDPLAITNF